MNIDDFIDDMPRWLHQSTHKGDSLDEAFTIKASPGLVEIGLKIGWGATITIPSQWINDFIRKLEAARDAAALMEGVCKT